MYLIKRPLTLCCFLFGNNTCSLQQFMVGCAALMIWIQVLVSPGSRSCSVKLLIRCVHLPQRTSQLFFSWGATRRETPHRQCPTFTHHLSGSGLCVLTQFVFKAWQVTRFSSRNLMREANIHGKGRKPAGCHSNYPWHEQNQTKCKEDVCHPADN